MDQMGGIPRRRASWVGIVMAALVATGLGHCGTSNGGGPNGQSGIDGGANAARPDGMTSADAPAGAISEEEWKRITGPYSGAHEVDTFASVGCPTRRIDPEYVILPSIGCAWRPGYEGTIRDCQPEPSCKRHADCLGKFDRCRGFPSSACVYPKAERTLCSTDGDCTAVPGGRCAGPFEPNTTFCYPTGRCEREQAGCDYREEACVSDTDCTSAAGGSCKKRILFARCEAQACLLDGDCNGGQRCACSDPANRCVPADCASDADCPAGAQCLLERGCHGVAKAYHCSTPVDTCHTKAECPTGYCTFDGSWACRPLPCPID